MKKKSVAKNFSYNIMYQLLTILLPLITTPYLSRTLGSEAIGIYGYTVSIATYFMLFASMGASLYGQREIAKVQDDKKKISAVFFEIIILKTFTCIISLVIFYLTFCMSGDYKYYYIILSLYIISSLFDINWLFQGLEDFSKTVIRNMIVKIISIVLIFVFIKKPDDLYIYILLFSIFELFGNISIWFYLPKYVDKIKIGKLKIKRHIKPILLLFLPQIATQIYTVLDKTMVGAITNNMNEVGFYEQAQKISRAALVIVAALQTVISSKVAYCYAKNDKKGIIENLEKGFEYVWMIGIPMCFGLIGLADNIVPWYYGKDFIPVANILKTISPVTIIIGLSGITGIVYLIQVGKQKHFTESVILGALINIVLNYFFIKRFASVGASIASVLSELFVLLYHLIYMRKDYKIMKMLKPMPKCLLSGIIMYIVIYFVGHNLDSTIVNTLLITIIGAITYFICLFLTKYDFLYRSINQLLTYMKTFMKGLHHEKK